MECVDTGSHRFLDLVFVGLLLGHHAVCMTQIEASVQGRRGASLYLSEPQVPTCLAQKRALATCIVHKDERASKMEARRLV